MLFTCVVPTKRLDTLLRVGFATPTNEIMQCTHSSIVLLDTISMRHLHPAAPTPSSLGVESGARTSQPQTRTLARGSFSIPVMVAACATETSALERRIPAIAVRHCAVETLDVTDQLDYEHSQKDTEQVANMNKFVCEAVYFRKYYRSCTCKSQKSVKQSNSHSLMDSETPREFLQ